IEDIPAPGRVGYLWCRPHLHAVSVGGKEIFLASGFRKGILHYQNGKWSQEPIAVPFGARLSLAGDKTVMVFNVRSAAGDGKGELEKLDNVTLRRKEGMVIQAWQRGTDGQWSGPRDLAREEQPLAGYDQDNELRPGLVVQAYAPPNFVPIAWNCKGQKAIKYLCVPVGEK